MTVAPMPAGHRLLALSDVPDRKRRDGPPELDEEDLNDLLGE